MARRSAAGPFDKRTPPEERLEQAKAAQQQRLARFAEQKAAREAEEQAKAAADAARPRRDLAAYGDAIGQLPLLEAGQSERRHPSHVYAKLTAIAAEAMNDQQPHAALCWPTADPSPSAVAALLALGDCAAAKPVTLDAYDALESPLGLRALIFPYARTGHRALRHLYVDKDYLAGIHTKHQWRSVRTGGDAALEDYHKTLARVRDLSGVALDGKTYTELRHPCMDEVLPSGPCAGAEGRSALLWRVGAKTDLKKISRNRTADNPAQAKFYLFGLRANEPLDRIASIAASLDLVLLDLDRTGRGRLSRQWQDDVKAFVEAVRTANPHLAIVGITDDPFAFDELRFQILGSGGRRREKRTPCASSVIFSQNTAIAGGDDAPAAAFEPVEKWEVHGFSGELGPLLARLRAAARRAFSLGDKQAARQIRALSGVLRRCASLPGSLETLSNHIASASGELAAADMMTAYRVGGVLQDLRDSKGPYAQHEHATLLALCNDIDTAWRAAARSAPMAPLLHKFVKSRIGASSRTALLFPKDMLAEFAEAALRADDEIGATLASKTDRGIISFIDRAGLDDLTALPSNQRNHTKTLIVVAPPRSTLLALLARPWLPDNVTILADGDALAGAAHDAERLARYPDLAPLAERLTGFATKARAEARRLANTAVDFEPELAGDDDVEFPLSGLVNLAGNLRPGQTALRFEFEGGQTLIARPGTKLVLQDRKRTVPVFAEVEARNVEVGDRVCVIGDAFLEMARPLLNITARAAEEIRDYHDLVLERFERIEGTTRRDRLAKIVAAMGLADVSIDRALYWVDLAEQQAAPLHEVVPHAPQDHATFRAFMKALGVGESVADRYWQWAVIAQRISRLRAAMTFHDAYRGILVDTYAAQSENPERAADVRRLRSAAEGHVSVVRAKSEERGSDAGP